MSIEIVAEDLTYGFTTEQGPITLFKALNFTFPAGKSSAIMGVSGAGKSTLLSLLANLENPNTGKVKYLDNSKNNQRVTVKDIKNSMSFIFQQFHLLEELNTLQNIAFPLQLRGKTGALDIANNWLKEVGLGNKATQSIDKLSGGEMQRVAIARALVSEPKLVFADEPTGSLDVKTGEQMQALMFDLCQKGGATLVISTHDKQVAQNADQGFLLRDGKLGSLV